jgi:hypothetical protein
MRSVSGLDRPVVQWLFVGLGVVLMGVAGGAAWMARQARAAGDAARAAEQIGRLERQQLDAQLARERATREALALELARTRAGGAGPALLVPTLTLTPLEKRGPAPPEPTVSVQHATQIIELRLILPAPAASFSRFDVTLRDWSSGGLVWTRGGLRATPIDRRPAIAAFVTGDVFRAGAYELLVAGVGADGRRQDVASYEVAVK